MTGWSNEIALVTGAAGSIGGAIATHLAALGAKVAGADKMTAPSAVAASAQTRFDTVDVTCSAQVDDWVNAVTATWGPPTIAVICAGKTWAGRLVDQSDADWRDVIAVNLDGAFFTARSAIRAMCAAGKGGRVVFIGSWAAHAPHPHLGNYSTSKAGLRALCRTLALDHAQDGIMVNEVAPGIVDAGLSRALFQTDPALATRTKAAIPNGRLIHPDSVARDVAFLASPDNLHTTGTVLISDGGLSLASSMNPGR